MSGAPLAKVSDFQRFQGLESQISRAPGAKVADFQRVRAKTIDFRCPQI